MAVKRAELVSVVVPVYNEAASVERFHNSLVKVLDKLNSAYEIIYCDDGSSDHSASLIRGWSQNSKKIRLIKLSRNFGKEIATTAGMHYAHGDCILTIDADGQHPVELIPDFINQWQKGAKVIIGVRTANSQEGWVKRYGSKLFYKFFNRFSGLKLVPGATDYRLIDRVVQQDFKLMTERNRITRGLIDWLGYERHYIEFEANARLAGEAGYSVKKLFKLALDSVISLSLSPLRLTAYIGAVILPLSTLLGVFMLINAALGDPAHLHATGTAYLMVLVLFLVGILLVSQAIIGLYLSHIHTETQNRPLYIIDQDGSANVG